MSTERRIIDAHAHLWLGQDTIVDGRTVRTTTRGRSFFFTEEVQMMPPFIVDGRNTAEIFLSNMDYAQVTQAVLTQEFIDGLQNDYLLDVSRRYGDRFRVCGLVDYWQPGFLEEARRLVCDLGFRAMAIPAHRMIDSRGRVSLVSPEMLAFWQLMDERGIIISLCLAEDPGQIAEMEEVLQQHPRLRVAISHFGMPTGPTFRQQVLLARHKEVSVESGGITWLYNSEFYPFPSAVRAIRQAADWVGEDKLMWGSDYPRTITAITYRMSYDFILKSSELSEEFKQVFLYDNARAFFRFSEMPPIPYIKNMSE